MAGFSLSVLRISAFSFPDFSFSTLSFSSIRRDLRPEGRAEPRSEARDLCGVPSERGVVFSGDSQGWHPGLVCDAPTGHGIGNAVGGPVSETQSRRRIGNAVGGRYRRHDRGTVSGTRSAAGIGNAVVPFALNGATHTSPGHRPGNYIPENQCVLKEHRIGKAGFDVRGPGNRVFFTDILTRAYLCAGRRVGRGFRAGRWLSEWLRGSAILVGG